MNDSTLSDHLHQELDALPTSPSLAEVLHLFLEGQPANHPDQEPWTIFVPWVTGHQASALAHELSKLNDQSALPGYFEWQATPEQALQDAKYSSHDRRSLKVFRELLKQERKSSKYYHEIKSIFERHPDSSIARLLLSYILRWEGVDAANQFAQGQLNAHPDWTELRLAWASQIMFRQNPRHPDPTQMQFFLEVIQSKLLLEEHLISGQVPTADLALLFYHATGFYYLLNHQFERAVFAINQAAELDPDHPLLLVLMMAFTALMVKDLSKAQAVRDFLLPLMALK